MMTEAETVVQIAADCPRCIHCLVLGPDTEQHAMSYTLLSETKPKAKKSHRCIWCGGTISVGETYVREKSTYDGGFQNNAWHVECDDAAKKIHAGEYEWEIDPWENERPSGVMIYPENAKRR